MPRPDSVTDADIERWKAALAPAEGFNIFALIPSMVEVIYAGQWFAEEMIKLGVPEEKIVELAYIGGRLSLGRDPWVAHQELLDSYKKNLPDATTT